MAQSNWRQSAQTRAPISALIQKIVQDRYLDKAEVERLALDIQSYAPLAAGYAPGMKGGAVARKLPSNRRQVFTRHGFPAF